MTHREGDYAFNTDIPQVPTANKKPTPGNGHETSFQTNLFEN